MEHTFKKYAVRRGNEWINKKNKWDLERNRKLYDSKMGCIRALNAVDKIGLEPSDSFKVALTCPDTSIVAVFVRVIEIDTQQVPVKVKIKKFRHRHTWYQSSKPVEGVMAAYDVDAMPGFGGYC
jgi:hypothetical protein